MIRFTALLMAITCLSSCSTVGSYVDKDQAQDVMGSVKTAKELSDALGTPSVTIPMGNDTTMWVYEGVHRVVNAAAYIPYVGLLAGGANKDCTRLTAIVNNDTGAVSDLKYETAQDSDFWATYEEKCKPKNSKGVSKEAAQGTQKDAVAPGAPVQ
ncbi:MAG: hypothetical protein R3F24_00305 [Gammaproteobacteria bacterium]